MKQILFYLFLLMSYSAVAQNSFTGIVNYKITVEGNNNHMTDSMSVVFSKTKVKVVLYLPDLVKPGQVSERVFIDDFISQKHIALNTEDKSYKSDKLNAALKYDFINTHKLIAGNDVLCFQYRADSAKFNKPGIQNVSCLASINHRNTTITNYFFLGIQPIIIDNRIVMDYIVTQSDGVKQRIYATAVKRIEDVESNFDLTGYRQAK